MQAMKHLFNFGPNVLFVAGLMIPPGEGRDVPLMYLPAEHQDAPVASVVGEPLGPSPEDLAFEMLKRPVKEIAGELPDLSDGALDLLAALEGEMAHPRKTLLEAVGAERMRRADAAMQAEADAATAEHLRQLDAEQRAAAGELAQG